MFIYIYTQVRLSGVPGAVPVNGVSDDTDVTYSVTAMELVTLARGGFGGPIWTLQPGLRVVLGF